MKFIKNLSKELPFGRIVLGGMLIYAGMLALIDIVILLFKSGVDFEGVIERGGDVASISLMLIFTTFMFFFIVIMFLIPQVIGLYPIVGYFYTYVKDNRMAKILPIDNKQKLFNLLRIWGKVILIYGAITFVEFLYLIIMFGTEIRVELEYIVQFFFIGVNAFGISILGTVIFSFSIIIAAMIQNIYKIEKWIVIVSYIGLYIVFYITRGVLMIGGNGFFYLDYISGLADVNIMVLVMLAIYVAILIGEISWVSMNINRVRVK